MAESRVKKTLLNARVNLIFYFLTLVLSFFSRKIFLDCLGADFVGLTGTMYNLLNFLNLAELGIGTAIGFLLYKPLFNNNHLKINEIISVMGYLYKNIGIIITIAGIILSAFLPLIFPDHDTHLTLTIIYLTYYAFLGSTLIGYFINYRQNLLGADQKNYVVTAYYQTISIIKILIQMTLAYITKNLILWIVIEFSFGIIYSYVLNWKINKTYPWLKANIREGKQLFKKYPEVMIKTRQLFIHRLAAFIQYQTTPFLTYAFTTLQTVAFLGNYTLVLDKVFNLLNTVLGSTAAGVGNLIAEGNKSKILSIFWQLNAIRIFCAGLVFFVCWVNFEPFIALWLGKGYIMNISVLIMVLVRAYFSLISVSTLQFTDGYGLFQDVWSSIAQTVIFIVAALIGGHYWGVTGILFAGFLSSFIILGIWKPIFLYKKGFQMPVIKFWLHWGGLNSLAIASVVITTFLYKLSTFLPQMDNFLTWGICTFYSCLLYIIVAYLIFYLFTPESKTLTARFIKRLN